MPQATAPVVDKVGSSLSRSDLQKELRDKLAWSVGSVLKKPYSGRKNPIMIWADRMARAMIEKEFPQETVSPNPVQAVGLAPMSKNDPRFPGAH